MLDSNSGEIIWIREIDGWYAVFQNALFLENGNILFHENYSSSILQMDPSNGDYSTFTTDDWDWYRVSGWTFGENGNIYAIGSKQQNSSKNIVNF